MRRRLALVALAAGTAVPLAACGGSVGNDRGDAARSIERDIAYDLRQQSGDPDIDVDCPRFPVRRGQEFECYAVDGYGDEYLVVGYVEDDRGSVVWEVQ
jgi:hypothetical protein